MPSRAELLLSSPEHFPSSGLYVLHGSFAKLLAGLSATNTERDTSQQPVPDVKSKLAAAFPFSSSP